jgi:hypothetical protein
MDSNESVEVPLVGLGVHDFLLPHSSTIDDVLAEDWDVEVERIVEHVVVKDIPMVAAWNEEDASVSTRWMLRSPLMKHGAAELVGVLSSQSHSSTDQVPRRHPLAEPSLVLQTGGESVFGL